MCLFCGLIEGLLIVVLKSIINILLEKYCHYWYHYWVDKYLPVPVPTVFWQYFLGHIAALTSLLYEGYQLHLLLV